MRLILIIYYNNHDWKKLISKMANFRSEEGVRKQLIISQLKKCNFILTIFLLISFRLAGSLL